MLKNERFETKQEEIRHRQYLVATYYAQGKGNDKIIELLKSEHSLSVSRATIGRDIYLIRRRNVEELKKDLESFKNWG